MSTPKWAHIYFSYLTDNLYNDDNQQGFLGTASNSLWPLVNFAIVDVIGR